MSEQLRSVTRGVCWVLGRHQEQVDQPREGKRHRHVTGLGEAAGATGQRKKALKTAPGRTGALSGKGRLWGGGGGQWFRDRKPVDMGSGWVWRWGQDQVSGAADRMAPDPRTCEWVTFPGKRDPAGVTKSLSRGGRSSRASRMGTVKSLTWIWGRGQSQGGWGCCPLALRAEGGREPREAGGWRRRQDHLPESPPRTAALWI